MSKLIVSIIVIIIVIFGIKWLMTVPPAELPSAQVGDNNTSSTSTTGDMQATSTNPSATSTTDKPYKTPKVTFNFTGYGPGKSETGIFKIISSNLDMNKKTGTITIEANSVSTGKEKLDAHLCSDDFFDCAKYPQIIFTLKSITPDPKAGTGAGADADKQIASGTLQFHGVTKDLSFPVVHAMQEAENIHIYKADFKLDTTPFKFKYLAINKEVRIEFSVMYSK